ncbi:DUF2892 domain-containing protein [Prosthecochloris sp. N3]|uniref:DUF2892 domain-containing protein n=1 Tax=Prosthecochloris ethylica TaxID=2743976 RepID=A0ABR9XUE2_9CHLB|nr:MULTISPECIES: DUF2892 domain-containing protein [Prosthecochloris]MEC9486814.1 DUF2892 domain-containing protein [Prosthecochloris sp.]MBF0587199.1 DUF2892 domain-containing protein [Prosthecochloris ethylica]MBF0637677.1 DUF2892 domain-containing protein [Prosthecochloris ethylica]NUK48327.1 DUF2892 domain-containing protein [Prosthecochloris ethylica]RNA65657.1 DUF2892 domain-containing protein [Prosthecochloris sp. ZM_2]
MQKNVGPLDRNIRYLFGAVMLIGGLIFQSWWGVAGLVLIFTAVIRYCPLYVPFGINTDGDGYGTTVGYEAQVKPGRDGENISV